MFKSKRIQENEAELERLRGIIAAAGGEAAPDLAREVERLRGELTGLQASVGDARRELASVQTEVVETRDTVILREVGIYEFRHPLDDGVAYKARLADLKGQIKAAVKQGHAVVGATQWSVDGSQAKGRKMVSDFSKLMLRAYNNEVDHLVRTMKPYKLDTAITRLGKTRGTIARLGKTMAIEVTDYYHRLRVYELELTADYLAKVAEEKERAREERERLREERKALQELKREEERLRKERNHRASVLAQLEAGSATAEEIARARQSLEEVDAALEGVLAREANVRAGYVYVISNPGTFGPGIVKVGMTRRLEPMDRVNELGGASVPFKFDVHTLVFSEDALGLESALHNALADRRVNLVNQRREYFYSTPEEVRDLLAKHHGQLLHYDSDAEALEWHQSTTIRKQLMGSEEAAMVEDASLAVASRVHEVPDVTSDPSRSESPPANPVSPQGPTDGSLQDRVPSTPADEAWPSPSPPMPPPPPPS